MKRILSFVCAFTLFFLLSCDNNAKSDFEFDYNNAGNITINGITYPSTTTITKGGGWGWYKDEGWFTVTIVDKKNRTLVYHDFEFKTSTPIERGDGLSSYSLKFYPDEGNEPYHYNDGNVSVIEIKNYLMTLHFRNLEMVSRSGKSYTFNGKVKVDFELVK